MKQQQPSPGPSAPNRQIQQRAIRGMRGKVKLSPLPSPPPPPRPSRPSRSSRWSDGLGNNSGGSSFCTRITRLSPPRPHPSLQRPPRRPLHWSFWLVAFTSLPLRHQPFVSLHRRGEGGPSSAFVVQAREQIRRRTLQSLRQRPTTRYLTCKYRTVPIWPEHHQETHMLKVSKCCYPSTHARLPVGGFDSAIRVKTDTKGERMPRHSANNMVRKKRKRLAPFLPRSSAINRIASLFLGGRDSVLF